jgi:proteasome lid subunit RPN8/RPN11
VAASIPGIAAQQGGTHVTFTQDTWQHIYQVKDRDYPEARIIGWYHSHPGFGVFLSDHDTFIHRNFFASPEQIAWVVDPISDEEGCFVWSNGEIHRAEKITVADPKGGENADERSEPPLSEVHSTASSHDTIEEPEPSQSASYLNWMFTVLSYLAVFGLGILLSVYLLIPPERVMIVPVDPSTGQPLDPRLREMLREHSASMPGNLSPAEPSASGTQPEQSGAPQTKEQSGRH